MDKKKLMIIEASPRAEKETTSALLADLAQNQIGSESMEVGRVHVRGALLKNAAEAEYTRMKEADALLIIFPLYFFCLPGMLIRFLQDYAVWLKEENTRSHANVYCAVNCGFPEPGINAEAARVIASFARQTGGVYRGGVLIGGGGMLGMQQQAPFVAEALKQIGAFFAEAGADVLSGGGKPFPHAVEVALRFPRKLYFMGGNFGWRSMAKKNGLKKKDLYARPYERA